MIFRTIGILGGMGPEGTAELYLKIIKIFQKEYGAVYDADFPEMVIVNLPIPDVVEDSKEEMEVATMLITGAKKLETAGADFIAMPCNTATYFLPAMQKAVSVPILSILKETADEVRRQGIQKVGVIGTEMTIGKDTYGKVLENITQLVPKIEEQKRTTQVIMNILAGKKNDEDRKFLLDLIKNLKVQGAEKVILGCTDLPLLVTKNPDTIDTIEVLARAVVREAATK
jgi:aspartate racemase